MKKIISVILILAVIMSFTSCRKASDDLSGNVSIYEIVDVSLPESSSTQEVIASEKDPTFQEQPSQKNFTSTIVTPKEVVFYKGGKFGVSTNEKFNLNVAKCVEAWYKNYENDTMPLTKTAVSEDMIAKLKQNETVVEICFDYGQEINLLGKIKLENTTRLLIPITGNQAYYVFRGNDAYRYQNGLHAVKGSGLEKYFDNIIFDKKVRDWQSTVIAPVKVTFYKDGKQSVSYDKEFNHKIARHIEQWFKYVTTCSSFSGITTSENITTQKYNSTAIELEFDAEFSFYGGFIQKDERKIFVSLDGEHPYTLFFNDGYYDTYWGNMSPEAKHQNKNLEQFFANRQFEDIILSQNEETKNPPKTEESTSQVEKSNKPTEPVFKTENINRITFYGYYGHGKGVDVPEGNMTEVKKWLGTFVIGEIIETDIKPGTNTHCVEIEYTDGTVIEQGLDVIVINGISYRLKYGTLPGCYWDLISQSTLLTSK